MNDEVLNTKIAEASKIIFSYCRAKTPNREEAEDLSQDILYELLKSSRNIRDNNAFYGFMWAVADNVYKAWCRKKANRNTAELTDDIASVQEHDPTEDDRDIYLLRRELSLLSEKYRRATILYYIDKYSCAEISRTLSISESMVKYLLFKSRKILKEGMNMERKLGSLSYNPKSLIPMYSGEGPNRFWDFMQSKIKQNILDACYNDSLTPQEISLETGIPLPYLDSEIKALEDKKLLLHEGNHYKTNIIIITNDARREMNRSASNYHERIADATAKYISDNLESFKNIGFVGCDFSDDSLRWALAILIFRDVLFRGNSFTHDDVPVTGWGEKAYLFCVEEAPDAYDHIFRYSGMSSHAGDSIYFFDYIPKLHGDHHDFYGNDRYIDIICDIAKGNFDKFGEYDLLTVAEMIRLGYVIKTDDGYKTTLPVYTSDQYDAVCALAKKFVSEGLSSTIREMNASAERILSDHTPKHLQDQVSGIASMDKFVNVVSVPASIMIEKGHLSVDYNPLEMPTNYIVIK